MLAAQGLSGTIYAEAPSDLEVIVSRAMGGSDEAFDNLYERFSSLTLRTALLSSRNPEDAEDICQEVWLRVQRKIQGIADSSAFPLWLHRLTTRVCIDAARKRARPLVSSLDGANGRAPDQAAIDREEGSIAWEALGSLPSRQAEALFLREIRGLRYDRIAEAMGTSVSSVESLLFRARQSLARSFDTLEASRPARCRHARTMMAGFLDGECSEIRRRALFAHLATCSECRRQLAAQRRVSAAFLPLRPFFSSAPIAPVAPVSPPLWQPVATAGVNLKAALCSLLLVTSLTGVLGLPAVIDHFEGASGEGDSFTARPSTAEPRQSPGVQGFESLINQPPASAPEVVQSAVSPVQNEGITQFSSPGVILSPGLPAGVAAAPAAASGGSARALTALKADVPSVIAGAVQPAASGLRGTATPILESEAESIRTTLTQTTPTLAAGLVTEATTGAGSVLTQVAVTTAPIVTSVQSQVSGTQVVGALPAPSPSMVAPVLSSIVSGVGASQAVSADQIQTISTASAPLPTSPTSQATAGVTATTLTSLPVIQSSAALPGP